MEEAAPLLHLLGRLSEISELLLSLCAGAILLIAAFLRNPPPTRGAKWLVLTGLFCFTFGLALSVLTIVSSFGVEAKVILWVQRAALEKKSGAPKNSKPAPLETGSHMKSQDEMEKTEKQLVTDEVIARDEIDDTFKYLKFTFLFFGVGLSAMSYLGLSAILAWKEVNKPSF